MSDNFWIVYCFTLAPSDKGKDSFVVNWLISHDILGKTSVKKIDLPSDFKMLTIEKQASERGDLGRSDDINIAS